MRLEVLSDEAAFALRAADIICDTVRERPSAILGLPSGTTPIPVYFELARRVDAGEADLRGVTAFAIDEFCGVSRATPGTNSAYFRQYLRFPVDALHIPNPAAERPAEHIAAFADAIVRAGGLDLCLLGIGANGHVAFNEPGSAEDSRARVVELQDASRAAHGATFGSASMVPREGLTLGIADIMAARALLVLATGARKAGIVRQALEDAPGADVPASWLRAHKDITWLLDSAAAQHLSEK